MLSEEEMDAAIDAYDRTNCKTDRGRANQEACIQAAFDAVAALRAQADARPVGDDNGAQRHHMRLQGYADDLSDKTFHWRNGWSAGVAYGRCTHPAPEAAQALSDELRDHLVAISAAIADQDDRAAQAMLREILSSASAATVAEPSETDRAVRCLSRKPSEKVKAVYTTWAHENGHRAKALADRIIDDYLLHYDFPTQGQSHMQDCIVSVLSTTLTEAPQATQPAESSDSRDDDAEFRAWREQQWSAGINPTERDAWMERARRERDLLASVATPAVDYTAQQQAEPVGDENVIDELLASIPEVSTAEDAIPRDCGAYVEAACRAIARKALAAQSGQRAGVAETTAARDVLAERERQVSAEGWTPEHDDRHDDYEMALAAIVYAESAVGYHPTCPDTWPWSSKWFKPSTPRRDLVKAGALILAEIERLDRAAAPTPAAQGDQS